MKRIPCFNPFRIYSDGSDAFGPKIVSADHLPGTPMDPRSSVDDDLKRTPAPQDLDVPPFHNGTTLMVKNELSERRRSLEYVNRPPSPSHFIQFTSQESKFSDQSPMESPKFHRHKPFPAAKNGNTSNGDKAGGYGHPEENFHNGSVQHPNSLASNGGSGGNGGDKEHDKEVSASEK